MTDKEKLQKLFQAALQDTSEVDKKPTLAFPVSPAPASVLAAQPAPVVAVPAAPQAVPVSTDLVKPLENAGLDAVTSAELGILLDEQMERKKRRRRREMLVTLAVIFSLTGGGYAWFVQSPDRVAAFRETFRDLRATGDISSMVAKYQKSLDRIATRSGHIDQATESLGVSSDLSGEKDVHMDEEMRLMSGDAEGKTVGERNKLLKQNFGSAAEKEKLPEEKEKKVAQASDEGFLK